LRGFHSEQNPLKRELAVLALETVLRRLPNVP
jgi:hypothetical protein